MSVAVAVLACGTLLACSGPTPAPAAAPAAGAGAPPSAAVTVAIPPVTVTVNNPGAGPRTALVLHATPESAQQVSLTSTSTISQTIGTNPPSDQSSPEVTLPLTARQHGSADAATHTVGLTIGTPSSPDTTLSDALAKAVGSTSTVTVTPAGAVSQLVLDPPAALSDAGRSAAEQAQRQAIQFQPVLPGEPVGVGAVWTVSQQIDSLGLGLRQDTVLTLNAMRDSTITLGVQVTQTPLTPTWTLPNDQGTLNVDSYRVTGGGTLTLDLTKPLPLDGRVQLNGNEVFSRPKDGLKLAQQITNGVSWKS